MIATAAATTVMTATAPQASCRRTFVPNFAGFGELSLPMADPSTLTARSRHPPLRKSRRARVAKPGVHPASSADRLVGRDLDQLLDRLERAVGLDHGHEHLVEAFVLLC